MPDSTREGFLVMARVMAWHQYLWRQEKKKKNVKPRKKS